MKIEELRMLTPEEKYKSLVNYIKSLKRYYDKGSSTSLAESIVGSSVTDDILKYVNDIDTKPARVPLTIKEGNNEIS